MEREGAADGSKDGGAAVVLAVDDYEDSRLLAEYVLADAGFRVLHAANGEDAMGMAREHRPDAILLDLYLVGVSGVDLAHRLRGDQGRAGIPIVAHTLSRQPLPNDERALFNVYVPEPAFDKTIVDAVRTASGRT